MFPFRIVCISSGVLAAACVPQYWRLASFFRSELMRTNIPIQLASAFMAGLILTGCSQGRAADVNPSQSIANESVSATDAICDAADRPKISSRDYIRNRPDDFYALCYARNEQVCATAQEFLNEFPQPKAMNRLDKGVFQAIGARFWKDRTTIPWRNEVVNAAKLDIFNNGKIHAVFQSRMGYGGIKIPMLFVSSAFDDANDIELNMNLFLSARKPSKSPEVGGLGPMNLHPIFPREYWWAGSSIAQIDDRNYLAVYAPADSFLLGRVSIIEMSDRKTGEYVCKFQARYQIQKNQ